MFKLFSQMNVKGRTVVNENLDSYIIIEGDTIKEIDYKFLYMKDIDYNEPDYDDEYESHRWDDSEILTDEKLTNLVNQFPVIGSSNRPDCVIHFKGKEPTRVKWSGMKYKNESVI